MAALSIVRDGGSGLEELAERANDFHARSIEAGRSRIEFAIESGKALIAAKESVAHGEWLPWLADNFNGGQSTAKNYMALNRNRQRVGDLLADNPDLSIREALKALAKTNEPKAEPDRTHEPENMRLARLRRDYQKALSALSDITKFSPDDVIAASYLDDAMSDLVDDFDLTFSVIAMWRNKLEDARKEYENATQQ